MQRYLSRSPIVTLRSVSDAVRCIICPAVVVKGAVTAGIWLGVVTLAGYAESNRRPVSRVIQ